MAARASRSSTSSFTAPVTASSSPTSWESNRGQSMPGVSSSSSVRSTLIHCRPRVTPGRSETAAALRPAALFINVDLPTLGIPSTMARSCRVPWPLASLAAIFSASRPLTAAGKSLTPLPERASVSSTGRPLSRKYARHSAVAAGSAWSTRFIITSLGLPPARRSMSGLRLAAGMRASISSHTASTSLTFSSIILPALVICPGNQCMSIF